MQSTENGSLPRPDEDTYQSLQAHPVTQNPPPKPSAGAARLPSHRVSSAHIAVNSVSFWKYSPGLTVMDYTPSILRTAALIQRLGRQNNLECTYKDHADLKA